MPGPPPKDPRIRERRNRKAGAARIEVGRDSLARGRPPARPAPPEAPAIPELPEIRCSRSHEPEPEPPGAKRKRGRPRKPRPPCPSCGDTGFVPWHRLTLAWWRDVWTSELSRRYLRVDLHGLWRLAILIDRYWLASETGIAAGNVAAEIRLQQQAYGLSPLDRSRLQWEVETPDDERRRAEQDDAEDLEAAFAQPDPRAVLRAVK